MPEFHPGEWVLDPQTGELFWCYAVVYDEIGACWLGLYALDHSGVCEFQQPAWRFLPVPAP